MNDDFEETRRLIRLKRYEQPPDGYLDGFLKDFHQRQRAEIMQQSSFSLFMERLGTYLSSFGGGRLMFAGGVAAAIALAVVVTLPKPPGGGGGMAGEGRPLPSELDAPHGTLSPVSSEMMTDPRTGAAVPIDQQREDVDAFRLSPRPHMDAETHAFEL